MVRSYVSDGGSIGNLVAGSSGVLCDSKTMKDIMSANIKNSQPVYIDKIGEMYDLLNSIRKDQLSNFDWNDKFNRLVFVDKFEYMLDNVESIREEQQRQGVILENLNRVIGELSEKLNG